MKFGIIVFPGSNCDHDAYWASTLVSDESILIWHKDNSIPNDIDCIIIPGGFSFGDYLRCGAIARFSNIMPEVIKFANNGGAVIGICNGFQILTESGLLPGVLLRNKSLKFVCKDVYLKTQNNDTIFTNNISNDQVIKIPIAHGDGNYFCDENTLRDLEENNQIVFKYSNENGEIDDFANPNGSLNNIAGICNKNKNVLGMMPHPERYSDALLGSDDGINIFKSIRNHFLN